MTNHEQKNQKKSTMILWIAAAALALALLFDRILFPEYLWASVVLALPLVAVLGILVQQNRKALKSRSAAYGLNSAVTIVLVVAIVGILNFLAVRYPFKADLTKNKVHTLSDQTIKVVKGLGKPVKVAYFATMNAREHARPLLENYKGLSTKFELEYVDPVREPTRTRQAGIKKDGTLQLMVGARESKIEEPTEEKITNALIKLLKDKTPALCAITGHGEKSLSAQDPEGYLTAKNGLIGQAYDVKDVNLLQEGKVPETCDAIAILGPTKAFFDQEIKVLNDYLDNGGRAVVALDINLKGPEYSPQLNKLLEGWYVKPVGALVVDPTTRALGGDAAVPIVATFSRENAITKDYPGNFNCVFPFSRPLEILTGAPSDMKVQWLAQTMPKSWGIVDLKSIQKGEVAYQPGRDKTGPLTVAVAVEGKQKGSKAVRNSRLVVFGSSLFASNNFSRYAGNIDFFLNATSWAMDDESMISIRSNEEGPGKVNLSLKAGTVIFWLTVILMPLFISAGGIGIWAYRRRL